MNKICFSGDQGRIRILLKRHTLSSDVVSGVIVFRVSTDEVSSSDALSQVSFLPRQNLPLIYSCRTTLLPAQ